MILKPIFALIIAVIIPHESRLEKLYDMENAAEYRKLDHQKKHECTLLTHEIIKGPEKIKQARHRDPFRYNIVKSIETEISNLGNNLQKFEQNECASTPEVVCVQKFHKQLADNLKD